MKVKHSSKILHWLDNGCYPGYVMFSCGFSYDEIMKLLKKKKAKHWIIGISDDKTFIDKGNYFGLHRIISNKKTGKEVNLYYIIIKDRFTFTDYEYCKLAHEILHICNFFLKDILDRDKEFEAEAYYHTHIMTQCLKILRS